MFYHAVYFLFFFDLVLLPFRNVCVFVLKQMYFKVHLWVFFALPGKQTKKKKWFVFIHVSFYTPWVFPFLLWFPQKKNQTSSTRKLAYNFFLLISFPSITQVYFQSCYHISLYLRGGVCCKTYNYFMYHVGKIAAN